MFGIVLTGHGGPEKLVWSDDLAKPAPGPGEVLIRVTAAGVNNTDVNTRLAWYSKGDRNAEDAAWSGEAIRFPRIQGADVCGTIVEIGAGILIIFFSHFRPHTYVREKAIGAQERT